MIFYMFFGRLFSLTTFFYRRIHRYIASRFVQFPRNLRFSRANLAGTLLGCRELKSHKSRVNLEAIKVTLETFSYKAEWVSRNVYFFPELYFFPGVWIFMGCKWIWTKTYRFECREKSSKFRKKKKKPPGKKYIIFWNRVSEWSQTFHRKKNRYFSPMLTLMTNSCKSI